jgi:Putative zinc-binding metallo-peptidase
MRHIEATMAILLATFVLQLHPSDAKELEEYFSITIVSHGQSSPARTSQGSITFQQASVQDLEGYIPLLVSELGLYPRSLIKKSKLKRIVLCEQLAYAGQFRNAVPDFEHNILYLEVKRGNLNKQYLRKVIHHDFYHMIDFQDDGQLYSDSEWGKLNAADFKYGTGGQNAQTDANSGVLTDKYPGFLNQYSTAGVEEDKAEVFAHMLVQSDVVEKRQAVDAVLKAKVDRMKELMLHFCEEVNENFWKAAREVKR